MNSNAMRITDAQRRAHRLASEHSRYKAFPSDADEDEAVSLLTDLAAALEVALKHIESATNMARAEQAIADILEAR